MHPDFLCSLFSNLCFVDVLFKVRSISIAVNLTKATKMCEKNIETIFLSFNGKEIIIYQTFWVWSVRHAEKLLKNEWREKVSIVIIHSSLISETAFPRGLSLKVRLKWLWNNCPHHGQEENDKPTRSIAPLYTKMQQRNDLRPRYLITKFLNRWIRWTFAYHNSSKVLKCCLFHFFFF